MGAWRLTPRLNVFCAILTECWGLSSHDDIPAESGSGCFNADKP